MRLSSYVLRNVTRNARRTMLTVLSIGVSMGLVVLLRTFVTELYRGVDASDGIPRLVTRHRTSLGLLIPVRHGEKIRALPGVRAVTPLNWFGGTYVDQEPRNFFARFSVDPQTFFDVYSEYGTETPEQLEAFRRERVACLAGGVLMDRFGWKVGDRITFMGDIYPVDLELTIRGVLRGPEEAWVIFHHKYLEESVGATLGVGTFTTLASDAAMLPAMIEEIDGMFRNSDAETRTETEKAFNLSFIEMLGNIRLLLGSITGVVVFAILLVAAGTMAMAVRERTREIAVLKAIGYARGTIARLLVAEGMLVALAGGGLGMGVTMLLLPRPNLFFAFAGGATTGVVLLIGALVLGALLPERLASETRWRLTTRVQHVLWNFGPWIALVAGLAVMGGLVAAIPAKDWTAFSGGFFTGMTVQPRTIGLCAAITLAIGVFSSVLPAWNASRVSVLEGLGDEG